MSKNKLSPVIMISGHATVQIAVEAIRLGAYEFIEKPFSTEKILNYVKRAIENSELKQEKDIIENKLFHSFDLIGKSSSILKVKKTIEKLATSESRVLISGPTGSGKELVARKIHKNSSRSKEPFVIINAALLKEKTYEKELFGEEFEDGNISFGALERANRGTLLKFLVFLVIGAWLLAVLSLNSLGSKGKPESCLLNCKYEAEISSFTTDKTPLLT